MNRRNFIRAGLAGLLLPPDVRAQSVMLPGPGISRVSAFTDNFNRSDEDLEASSNWTRVGGVAGALAVRSNKCACIDSTQTAYQCPDQGTANHYTQAVWYGGAASAISVPLITVRMSDQDNFIGLRHFGANWEIYKWDTGTPTLLASQAGVTADGDVMYLSVDGSNQISAQINGGTAFTATDSFNSGVTRQGLLARGNTLNPWIDDFQAGAL